MDAGDRLRVDVTGGQGEATCVVAGEIDPVSGPVLERELAAVLTAPELARLVLDLGGVTFLDSSGLRQLIEAHQAMQARGGELVLRGPSATVLRILEITNLTQELRVER